MTLLLSVSLLWVTTIASGQQLSHLGLASLQNAGNVSGHVRHGGGFHPRLTTNTKPHFSHQGQIAANFGFLILESTVDADLIEKQIQEALKILDDSFEHHGNKRKRKYLPQLLDS